MLAFEWCFWGVTPFCFGWFAEKLIFPILVAVLVYKFAIGQLKKKRAIDFAEKKLTEFYAPIVAARTDILAFTKFDRSIRNASQLVDIRKQKEERRSLEEYVTQEYAAKAEAYQKELEAFFDGLNKRFDGEGIDALVEMRKIFVTKYAYADDDTQRWYEYFYSFVEMWRMTRLNKSETFMSPAVENMLGGMFDEELLQPFYTHLQERARFYQGEIGGLKVAKATAPAPPSAEPEDLVDRLRAHPFLSRFLRVPKEGE
jgi:hypothetical protein